ncbi:MAG: hypothetical protein U0326_19410 [Polyangiales bacterium]
MSDRPGLDDALALTAMLGAPERRPEKRLAVLLQIRFALLRCVFSQGQQPCFEAAPCCSRLFAARRAFRSAPRAPTGKALAVLLQIRFALLRCASRKANSLL